MMTFVVNVPGLLLDFCSEEIRMKYEKLEEYILTKNIDQKNNESLNSFESAKLKLLDDAYSIEELSYRSRVFVFSYLSKCYIEKSLIRFNLDSYITNVISLDTVIPAFQKEIINKIINILHSKNWVLLTRSRMLANVFNENGIKTIVISRRWK